MIKHRARPLIGLLAALALLGSGGCNTHSVQPLPGRLASQLLVDAGDGDLAGRVMSMHYDRRIQSQPLETPVSGAQVELLDPLGAPVKTIGATATDSRGRFNLLGLAIGESYIVRARVTDATGRRQQLMAYVRAEGPFTCVELSLASTIVAQKIIVDPRLAPNYDPEAIDELVQNVRRTLADMLEPLPLPTGGPGDPPPAVTTAPPPMAANPPAAGQAPGEEAPRGTVWVPGPDGEGGYWWSPGSGGAGGCWWIPAVGGGGYWWSPEAKAPEGQWWVPGAGAPGGAWQPAPRNGQWLSMPNAAGAFTTSPAPIASGDCFWIPALDGSGGGYWFLPNADGMGGSWWRPGAGGGWRPAAPAQGPAGAAASPLAPATGGASIPGSGGTRYTWITMPDGSGRGYYWTPASGGAGGAWWVPTPEGGYWWTPADEARPTQPKPSANCTCVWVQFPGSSRGYWFQPGAGGAGSWWIAYPGGGYWWSAPASGGGSAPTSPLPPAGSWTTPACGGCPEGQSGASTGYVWITLPGGVGGHWWSPAAPGGSPGGAWWRQTAGGGSWWTMPAGQAPATAPKPSADCTCVWIAFPGGDGTRGAWFQPASSGLGGAWWTAASGGGGTWWDASSSRPALIGAGSGAINSATSGTPGAATPGGGTSYVWIARPGGGGHWWARGEGAGSWWIPSASGGYWFTPTAKGGYYWVPSGTGTGGHWWSPSPTGDGGCWWVPLPGGGGHWVWVTPSGTGSAAPAPGTSGGAISHEELQRLIEALLGASTPVSDSAPLFDRLSGSRPDIKQGLGKALETFLDVQVIMPFRGQNMAPFPRKADPRYIFVGDVNLTCVLTEPVTSGVAYALNGQEIGRATSPGDLWRVTFDSRTRPDGEYFLTAHEIAPEGLGRMLGKGYARIRNLPAEDDPCADQWDGGNN